MVKIGCIGHAGRHGEFFSRVFNRDQHYPGYAFSYVFGEDEYLTQQQKDERFYGIEKYCDTVDELIALSDAVMILTIPGESHLPYARKVIAAGKPLFVDKPFSVTEDDARAITEAAREAGVPLCGGSTLCQMKAIADIQALMEKEHFDFISIAYRADPEAELGLYPYYASHVADTLMTLCGEKYGEISVTRNGKNVATTVKYPDVTALVLTTLHTPLLHITLYGRHTYSFELSQDECYIDGAANFVRMIETGTPPAPYAHYVGSVKILQDITRKMNASAW